MVSVRRIIGLVVLLLGVLVVAISYAGLSTTSGRVPEESSGSQAEYGPNILGSGTFTVSWSGAPSATALVLYSCPDATCSDGPYQITQLTLVAQASGSSGSLSANVQGGHDYLLIETGSSSGLSVTEAQSGLTWLGVIGTVLAVLGVVLVVLPARARAAAPEEEHGPEVEETVLAPPPREAPVELPTPVYRPPPSAANTAPEVPMSSLGSGPSPSTVMGGAGAGRAPIKCGSCGTMNEPWLTNCRYCKRTLSISQNRS
jgi:hypothetical protein